MVSVVATVTTRRRKAKKGGTDIREKLLELDADHERRGKKLRMRSARTATQREARKFGTE